MTIGSILLAAALVALVGLYIARPLLTPAARGERLSRRDALLAQKEALLARIRDLDFDLETAKLAPAEHQAERAPLLAEAAAILRQLDTLEREPAAPTDGQTGRRPRRDQADDEIEAAVARLRRETSAETPAPEPTPVTAAQPISPPRREAASDEAIEAAIARRRQGAATRPTNGAAAFCPQCGRPADTGDRFCAHCGYRLAEPQRA
jgi:hypothetical protein